MWSSLDSALLPDERVLIRLPVRARTVAVLVGLSILSIVAFPLQVDPPNAAPTGQIDYFSLSILPFMLSFLLAAAFLSYGICYLLSGAILTDRRVLIRHGVLRRPKSLPLSELRGIDFEYGVLVLADKSGGQYHLARLDLRNFTDAIAKQTNLAQPPILSGKLSRWNKVYRALLIGAFLVVFWGFLGAQERFTSSGSDVERLLRGIAFLLFVVVFVALDVIPIIVTIVSPLILRVGLEATEFRALFDHYIQARARGERLFKFTFHFRAARRFASVLYGERV